MRLITFALLALIASGCDRASNEHRATAAAREEPSPAMAPENTKINERDRNPAAITPGDQGSSEADRTLTQNVRQGVVKADGMSTAAKNVKIVTRDGVVTLRGPVKTDEEKSSIASIAHQVAGVKRVDNQLEVSTN
jgi:hyperosmotically inducible protein